MAEVRPEVVSIPPDRAKRFREKVLAAARAMNFFEDAEDFAQDACLAWLESGREYHKSPGFAVIDAARARYGRPSRGSYEARDNLDSAYSIDLDRITPETTDLIVIMDLNLMLARLNKKERLLLTRYYLEEWTLPELGRRYRVSGGRICQRVKAIFEKLAAIQEKALSQKNRIVDPSA